MEEMSQRQKSRETWLKERDKNTALFHRMANSHKRHNHIKEKRINGVWLEESSLCKDIVGAFQAILLDAGEWRANIQGLIFSRIFDMEAASLVLAALRAMNGDKALGPNGFTIAFWQSSWEVVKNDVMRMFKEFHDSGKLVKSLNNSFIVMIPKKGGAKDLKDFRPISPMGSIYKLLAKVLANRLKRVMGKLVNRAHNAFVECRQILDASLIANEVIDSMLRKKERGVICKLSIEKAYDSINWQFLFEVLHRMGFGRKRVNWMKLCITTTSFSAD